MTSARDIGTATALLAAADTIEFLARRPRLFREHPQRAGGSLVFAAVWSGLAAATAGHRDRRLTTGLAAVAATGQAALLAVHVKHGVASTRVYAGAALGAIALGAAASMSD